MAAHVRQKKFYCYLLLFIVIYCYFRPFSQTALGGLEPLLFLDPLRSGICQRSPGCHPDTRGCDRLRNHKNRRPGTLTGRPGSHLRLTNAGGRRVEFHTSPPSAARSQRSKQWQMSLIFSGVQPVFLSGRIILEWVILCSVALLQATKHRQAPKGGCFATKERQRTQRKEGFSEPQMDG
jgi:hypothetical protein